MDPFAEVIESYYLETNEGLFFAVKGMEHPPDRFIAVLRYAPDPDGDRKKGDIPYRRLYHFDEQEDLIRSTYPQYLSYDRIFQTTLQGVPKPKIKQIYDPCARLLELVRAPLTPIHQDLAAFAMLLQRESEVPPSAIGVSGSVLISMDAENSDLDVSIFGKENCRNVYETLARLLDCGAAGLRRLNESEIGTLYAQRVVADAHINFQEFSIPEKRKVCQGVFRQRPYFIRFLKCPHETGIRYGDLRYTPLGQVTIDGVISSDEEAFYTPCRYGLSDVSTLEGPSVRVTEVVSFRGRFCEQVGRGQVIRASGALERVENTLGQIYYRLLLGNSTHDKIVPNGVRH